ncbi:MAG: hypothetical protein IJU30_06180 [Lachnospiraceae bacterium]|nr:hypothetical protein [Lachnospiraceae bacterium]
MADIIETIDLHMHSTVSDGTDTPEEILAKVCAIGLDVFSITDHDAIKSASMIPPLLHDGNPRFITGVEFSCKDIYGKYHILGYGYDPEAEPIRAIVEKGHGFRMEKTRGRLEFLRDHFGFQFPDAEIKELLHLDNPGKPHIANLMIKHGYAQSRKQAIEEFIDKKRFKNIYLQPEEAIHAIALSGGIPVLAHPSYGSGDELIIGAEMDERLRRLTMEGLKGVEAYYSGFTPKLQQEMLGFAEKYDLYVTAGSDYHGKNKLIDLGDNNLDSVSEAPEGVRRFLRDVHYAPVLA